MIKTVISENSRWRTVAVLKIVFRLYLGAILADVCESFMADVESHANRVHVTKTPFRQFNIAPAATLKVVFVI